MAWVGNRIPTQVFLDFPCGSVVKNPPAIQDTWVRSWVRKIPWRRERLPTPVFWPGEFHRLYNLWGHKESDSTERLSLSLFPGGSVVKNPSANARDRGDLGSIPGWGRVPRRGDGNPLQYYCLKNPMDRGAWQATVHGIPESDTTEHTHTHTQTHVSLYM